MKDLLGKAIAAYHRTKKEVIVHTETSISDIDELPISYFFRSFAEMNSLEQKAMQLAQGNVLDIGCGAGAHSLYLQNSRHLSVTAIDHSPKSIEVCQARGVRNAICTDLFQFQTSEKFDTILLLMNGTGIFESLEKISTYLQKLRDLLAPEGKIYIDSTDILYMYDQDEDGAYYISADGKYYGELDFWIHYQGEQDTPITWLYLDFNTLQNAALANGFDIQLILQQEENYLAMLSIAKNS